MKNTKTINGFSKLSKCDKIRWIAENYFKNPDEVCDFLEDFWHSDTDQQEILDGFSENTISNFPMPYGVAPNFLINDTTYIVPMVIEESSVVAAASAAAKFWMSRGGFRAQIIGTKKIGQLHFKYNGTAQKLKNHFTDIKNHLINGTKDLTANMEKRGGGVVDLELLDFSQQEAYLFQIRGTFETCDSMGANFINSILETWGGLLQSYIMQNPVFTDEEKDTQIVMAILSNFTPDCLVRCEVRCPVDDLGVFAGGLDAHTFAEKFALAVRIAHLDEYRATTHNKGIYNGVDAVVLATGNDFRAIEACGHAYAAKDGKYRSLTYCEIKNNEFRFWIDLPLAVGTVGGLTKLHPLAKTSLDMLGNPSAEDLMKIIAAVGLAQNFAALRSLVTTGIQQGHMKMHLQNILSNFNASSDKKEAAQKHFEDKTVSYSAVRAFLEA